MKTYTEREIRMADVAAAVLFGFGVIVALAAAWKSFGQMSEDRGGNAIAAWVLAVVFLALGTALNLKVRQIRRDGHREKEHPDEKSPEEIEETFE